MVAAIDNVANHNLVSDNELLALQELPDSVVENLENPTLSSAATAPNAVAGDIPDYRATSSTPEARFLWTEMCTSLSVGTNRNTVFIFFIHCVLFYFLSDRAIESPKYF